MRTLLKKLGNPQDQFRTVHVAGTKGKGSTCAMIASMLQACGYKVGLYTSPHLIDIRERICRQRRDDPAGRFRPAGPAGRADRRPDEADADLLRRADGHRVQVLRRAEGRYRRGRDRPGRPARQHQRHQAGSDGHHQHQQRPHGPARADAGQHRRRRRPASSRPASPPSACMQDPEAEAVAEARRREGRRPAGHHRQEHRVQLPLRVQPDARAAQPRLPDDAQQQVRAPGRPAASASTRRSTAAWP